MKLYAFGIYDLKLKKKIYYNYDLSNVNIIYRYIVSNYIYDYGIKLSKIIEENKYYEMKDEIYNYKYKICAFNNGDKCALVMTEENYPSQHAFDLLKLSLNNNNISTNNNINLWNEYKIKENKINNVKEKIEETKNIILMNLDKILDRDEKISKLYDDIDDLKRITFDFKKETGKLNRCCTIQ